MRSPGDRDGGGRARLTAWVATAALAVGGAAAVTIGVAGQQSPPRPPDSQAQVMTSAQSATSSAPAAAPGPDRPGPDRNTGGPDRALTLPVSEPTVLDIPAIDVHHRLIQLGRNSDGTLEVPSLDDVQVPGWDRYSPTPGELGPSILAGHVDSAEQGDGVFYRLGALRKGDAVNVTRADGMVAVFEITGVDTYAKADFPTLTVYGNTDEAALRLITCGGSFDATSNNYQDNVVAYGTLVSSHPAA